MNFEEHAAKPVLRAAGIATPDGALATTPDAAAEIARRIGPCVVKAQVPAGKRGKAGGIKRASDPDEARRHATAILGMTIGGAIVERVLVEAQVPIAREMYAAVLNDPASKGPLLLYAAEGGMDIEELAAARPGALTAIPIDIRRGLDAVAIAAALPAGLPCNRNALADCLARLYRAYADSDAELLEINPLVQTTDGRLVALDCKLVLDDSAIPRRAALAATGTPEPLTVLEARGKALGLKFIEFEGNVGVLANGAGLTMTTMDAVRHFGGRPANFLEIGGESYTKAKPALELVLANPGVAALLVNFCGAFARTDVMTEGVISAWTELKPDIPIVFTIHGTGEDEAIAMVRERLGIEPYDRMDDAVRAAVAAAADRSGAAR
jgi:succinyl-CoA synthetase beta subunit